MKKIVLFCLSVFLTAGIMAKVSFGSNDTLPRIYLEPTTGINNYTGMLGVGVDVSLHNRVMLKLGGGYGNWGGKFSAGIKYTKRESSGWGLGLSYSISTGLKDVKLKLKTTTETRDVKIDLLTASTINLTASYNWVYRNHNRLFLEFGYGLSTKDNRYKVADGSILSTNAKDQLHLIQPGGLIVGVGFMFAL